MDEWILESLGHFTKDLAIATICNTCQLSMFVVGRQSVEEHADSPAGIRYSAPGEPRIPGPGGVRQ